MFVLLIAAGTHVLALNAGSPLDGVPGSTYALWVVLSLWALGRWSEARKGSRMLLPMVLMAGAVVLLESALVAAIAAGVGLLALAGSAWALWPGMADHHAAGQVST